MSALRDVKEALTVQQMTKYGYFDDEIMLYGYAYKQGETIIYKISEDAKSIYQQYHRRIFDNVYSTPIVSTMHREKIATGQLPLYKRQYKIELINFIRSNYGEIFFDALLLFQTAPRMNGAIDLLMAYLDSLTPTEESLQLFTGICMQALEAKQLTDQSYQLLLQRFTRMVGQDEDTNLYMVGKNKKFSGFAYQKDTTATKNYYVSAIEADTYQKYYQLRQNGIFFVHRF